MLLVVVELLLLVGEELLDSRRLVEAGDDEDVDDDEVDADMMALVLAFLFGATNSVLWAAATALRGMLIAPQVATMLPARLSPSLAAWQV